MKFVLILPAVLFVYFVQAQSVYNHGSIISIKPNTIFSIDDSLVNNGVITNNGSILISGAWLNNKTYDAGNGQIAFHSDHPQVINHNDQSFSRLTISGGGEKIFQANITIENELNLTDGVLKSENNARIIFNEGSAIQGGSDASHIKGEVYHMGSGDKVFPVGNGLVYLPVTIENIEGPAEIGMKVVEFTGLDLTPSPPLTNVSDNRYWQLDVVSGSLQNTIVKLPVRNESVVLATEEVVVSQAGSLSEDFEGLGRTGYQGSVTNGIVTSSLPVTKSILAIATSGAEPNDQTIEVFNAVSPNGDGVNDFLRIGNIELYPNNKVSIFNRWGDRVFEVSGYDNNEKVFRGEANVNGSKALPSSTYFYVIDKKDGSSNITGYLSLKLSSD